MLSSGLNFAGDFDTRRCRVLAIVAGWDFLLLLRPAGLGAGDGERLFCAAARLPPLFFAGVVFAVTAGAAPEETTVHELSGSSRSCVTIRHMMTSQRIPTTRQS